MNTVKILFFATIKDRAGKRSLELELSDSTTVSQLKKKLGEEFPNLSDSLQSVLVSVNNEYSFDDAVIPQGAEIALFPPVSGG